MNIHFVMTKKEKILKTALKLIVKQGIQETPMSQISKVSGVAIGTIYHHFKSKTEIINHIYIDLKKEFGELLMYKTEDLVDYKAKFIQIWRNLFEFYNTNELKFKFSQQIGNSAIIDEQIRQEGIAYNAPVFEYFENGIKSKLLKPVDIYLLVETIHGNVSSLVGLCHKKTIECNETVLMQAINMSWDSIANNKIPEM